MCVNVRLKLNSTLIGHRRFEIAQLNFWHRHRHSDRLANCYETTKIHLHDSIAHDIATQFVHHYSLLMCSVGDVLAYRKYAMPDVCAVHYVAAAVYNKFGINHRESGMRMDSYGARASALNDIYTYCEIFDKRVSE